MGTKASEALGLLRFARGLPDYVRRIPRLLYIIVGDGPGRVQLEAQCRGKGIVDRFRFPGWIEHTRMPDYLRLADIVVMPSESEGQSLVYLEAQACGRVLLASRIEGARIIRDGENRCPL
jgi:1,2-diacylglycerol 3-alpha-glucosyltransferase